MTQRLLLIGAGHAHAQVLRDWITAPVPGVDLVLVSPSSLAPYSGMVPGWLAGVYRFEEICIDFAALAAAGLRLVALPALADIDLPADLVHLQHLPQPLPLCQPLPHTPPAGHGLA